MKEFLDDNFLLQGKTAQRLYHDYAAVMPIIDYHCHLSPDQIANDHKFSSLTELWLNGDHYKWRAMRTSGVAERCVEQVQCFWVRFRLTDLRCFSHGRKLRSQLWFLPAR